MHSHPSQKGILLAAVGIALFPGHVLAQRAMDDAVTSSDDAFGHSIGTEKTGIYSTQDTRGFSPLKAGNARIDGIYYDPVGVMQHRFSNQSSIRVGFSAESFPFQAPTGIVDYAMRTFSNEHVASPARTFNPYGGWLNEVDIRIPVAKDHLTITGGGGNAISPNYDRSENRIQGWAVRPILRLRSLEIAPFYGSTHYTRIIAHPLFVVPGDVLPATPEGRPQLVQDWAGGRQVQIQKGGTLKAAITPQLALRAGLFHNKVKNLRTFAEMYTVIDPATASHKVIADPRRDAWSDSGEVLVTMRLGTGPLQQRIFAGYRARDRKTETGGADSRNFGAVTLGVYDPQPEPDFVFGPTNKGNVRQSAWEIGYSARREGLGSINLGLQKARYRATNRNGLTGLTSSSHDSPWLYNAAARLDLTRDVSIYAATQRGLEDSGQAPETAANRNAQLPAVLTSQYEGGLRWKFAQGQLVVAAFQIAKPFFSFDSALNYVSSGKVRHRGLEASLSGQFGQRLNVLAGAVVMQPRVLGAARAVAARPTGTPSLFARFDVNYRTDVLGGLTPTLGLTYLGRRPAAFRNASGRQLMAPDHFTVDLGMRHKFMIGKIPASIRAVVQNVTDHANWLVAGPGVLTIDERRRLTLTLVADL